jgi:hypothetical protein
LQSQPITAPSPAELPKQGQRSADDDQANEQLQAKLQHGVPKGLSNFRQETAKLQRMAMERQVHSGEMDMAAELARDGPLRPLSLTAMETLLAALDPRLDGFGAGPSCLDDALAYLSRLARGTEEGEGNTASETQTMAEWIETWRAAGGNRQTLRLMVQTLMRERMGPPSDARAN